MLLVSAIVVQRFTKITLNSDSILFCGRREILLNLPYLYSRISQHKREICAAQIVEMGITRLETGKPLRGNCRSVSFHRHRYVMITLIIAGEDTRQLLRGLVICPLTVLLRRRGAYKK